MVEKIVIVYIAITFIGFCVCWVSWISDKVEERDTWSGYQKRYHRERADSARRMGLWIWAWPVLAVGVVVGSLWSFLRGDQEI